MSETSGQDKLGNEQTNDDKITVAWETKPTPFGTRGAWPITRSKSDAERAMTNMFRLAEEADNFEDCINNFAKAAEICHVYGLQMSPPPPPPEDGGQFGHQARMDAWRMVTTIILVLGVLAIVAWSLSLRNARDAAQYAAPVSGLAGICLGWLFTNQQSSPSPRKQDPEP